MISRTAILSLFVIASASAVDFYPGIDISVAGSTSSESVNQETSNLAVAATLTSTEPGNVSITSKASEAGPDDQVSSTNFFPIDDLQSTKTKAATETDYFPITEFATSATAAASETLTISGAGSETLPSFFAMIMALAIM